MRFSCSRPSWRIDKGSTFSRLTPARPQRTSAVLADGRVLFVAGVDLGDALEGLQGHDLLRVLCPLRPLWTAIARRIRTFR